MSATIQYTGHVTWIPPVVYDSSCLVDMTKFPFDEQTCYLKFGSWTYSSKQLDLVSDVIPDEFS